MLPVICTAICVTGAVESSIAEEIVDEEHTVQESEAACSRCNVCDVCIDPQTQKAVNTSVVDNSHRYITGGFDFVAKWFDGFFGNTRTDRESAHSIVRLHFDNIWEESRGYQDEFRLRGKIRLPNLKERLHLVFSDEDDESGIREQRDALNVERDDQQEIGLQLEGKEESRLRIDHRLSIRSSAKLRFASRARYEQPLSERWLARTSEELFWQDAQGFGSRTRLELDFAINEKRLARFHNRFDFTEKSDGVNWYSTLSLSESLSQKQALSLYLGAEGVTRPDYLTKNYASGIVYRVNTWKKWFFVELEPQYNWRKAKQGDRRKGLASIVLRLEVVFSEDHSGSWKSGVIE